MKNNFSKKLLVLLLSLIFIVCLFTVVISAEETEEHIVTETFVYKNGFTNYGSYKKTCSCGDSTCSNNKALTRKSPMFTMNGFSMPEKEDNSKGLSFSYQVNLQMLEEYERINNSKITYGFLLSGAKNYENKPEKIKTGEFAEHFATVDIRINYGQPDANGKTKYDKYDVIFAGRVTEEKASGEKVTTYFQVDTPTGTYSNSTFGTFIGINYDTVIGKQNDENKWQDNKTIDIENGQIIDTTSQIATTNYIKVNKGDTIGIPSSLNVHFTLFLYNYVGGEYEYVGYVDGNGASEGNWSNQCTISEDNVVLVGENEGKEIDFNELYVRVSCKSTKGSTLTYTDIEESILFNLIEEPDKMVTVTFKNGDTVYEKVCIKGTKLGKTPSVTGELAFLGWALESDTTTVYTKDSIINEAITLVPVFNEKLTDVKPYLEWSQSYMIDETGSYLASDASRYLITSLIKVNAGDTISIPTNSGHRLIIYCYSDQYGTYEANSIIDCNTSDNTSSYENWGYTYTFKNSIVLENGKTINCDNLYVRVAFRKDDSGRNGSVNVDTIKNNVTFNITADNSHLIHEDNCSHVFDTWKTIQERDCLLDGIDARDCLICSKREVRYSQAVGHKAVIDAAVEANCGVDGLTEGSHCEVCGTVIKAQQVVSSDGLHQYNELVTLTQEPTTSATGKGTFKCIVCGATREETIDKIVNTTITKDYIANITTDEFNPAVDNIWKVFDGNTTPGGLYGAGNDWFGNVGDKLIVTLDREITLSEMKVYVLGNWTFANFVVKDASGKTTASKSVNASTAELQEVTIFSGSEVKAYTVEVEITSLKWNSAYTFKLSEIVMKGSVQDPRLPHTHVYNEFVKTVQEATCQVAGKDQYKCYCGMVTEKSTTKTDHIYDVLSEIDEPTCTVNGAEVYKCRYCSNTQLVTLDKTGHNYSKFVSYVTEPSYEQNGSAIFKCIHCDQTQTRTVQALTLGKAEHVRVESIKDGVVTIIFNVYGEEANYEIRYSTSEITNQNFTNATQLDATVKGNKEYTATFSLNANLNNSYYVAIRPYIGSNYGEVTCIRVGGNKLIEIDYHSANVYSGELLNSFAKLFDEQKSERSKEPTSQLPRLITDTKDTVLYNMNLSPIVDLEYMHYVSSTYLYFASSGVNIKVRWSDTPVDAYAEDAKWDGVISTASTIGWNEFKIDTNTRYIQIIFMDGSAPYEMLVYGYQCGDGDEIATEIGSLPTIGEMMGMCGFVAGGGGNTPIDSVSCTTVLREYHNFGWTYSLTAYPGKASFFNSSWMANFDSQYRDYKRAGINVIPCVQWDLVNIPQSNQVDENNLPIKSNGSFVKSDFWGKMNPHTYFMYADSMFAFSARYGSNKSTNLLNTLALHVSDTNNVGLNYLSWIELGNEPDGSWNGIHNYYSAYQIAALTSAAYDGHCRTMVSTQTSNGYHLGLKNADPNMKGAMAGVSAVSNEYITAMCYWMKANRQDGKVAFDAFNVHCYMTKVITLPNGSTTYVGASPEEAGVVNTLSQLISIRDKYYPEKEVWITEFGWDTNQSYATSTSSHAYSNEKTGVSYTGREVQAMWLTRTYLLLSGSGIDKATMYMCEDCGVEELSVGKYGTAGVIGYKYDDNGNTVEFKKESYYYLYTLKNTLGDYTFARQIEAYDENVYIYQYKTEDGKVAYAVWCGTSDGTVSNNYQLRIDGTNATIVENENGNVYGKKTDVQSDELGYISIDVTEKPIYILVD